MRQHYKFYFLLYLFIHYVLDMGECSNSTLNNCDLNANCTNTNGSYSCACLDGYSGDGYTCTGKN